MIRFIRGTVYSFGVDYVIVDCNGIGYYINFVRQDQISLGQQVTIFTYQVFREDDQLLFGFLDSRELELFERLISVKGMGPKTAMSMLAHASYVSIITAIENGQVDVLKKLPGLGTKTAQQIILDLKGKLVDDDNNTGKDSLEVDEVASALKGLGYKAYEINAILPELRKRKNATVDELLKDALRLLLQRKGV